ncbi:hypothetical protein JOM56_004163 [Amanita muscaria]
MHVYGLVAAAYVWLLITGFVGFQFAENGTPLLLWALCVLLSCIAHVQVLSKSEACLSVFGIAFFVATANFKNIPVFNYTKSVGLWIVSLLFLTDEYSFGLYSKSSYELGYNISDFRLYRVTTSLAGHLHCPFASASTKHRQRIWSSPSLKNLLVVLHVGSDKVDTFVMVAAMRKLNRSSLTAARATFLTDFKVTDITG